MQPYQFLLIATLLVLTWFYFEVKADKRKQKMAEFMEFHKKAVEWIRDQADRFNFSDAEKTYSYISITRKKSFCKKTDKLTDDLFQLWKAKFAHLYKS